MSLQPNAGSQGEYAGLLVIRAYHRDRGERRARRLPDPGLGARHQPGVSAVMAGMRGGGGGLRRRTATSTSPTCEAKAAAARRAGWPR